MEYLGNKKNECLLKNDTIEHYCDVIKNFVKSYKNQYNLIKFEESKSNNQSKSRVIVIKFPL
jgi:hypothetical protein